MDLRREQVFVFFELFGRRYAFPADDVREVFQMMEPAPVPGWPREMAGLLDIRGELVPLLRLNAMLRESEGPVRADQYIVILSAYGASWGVVVDEVEGVRAVVARNRDELSAVDLLALPEECLGVVQDEKGTVLLLDPKRLFRDLNERCRTAAAAPAERPRER